MDIGILFKNVVHDLILNTLANFNKVAEQNKYPIVGILSGGEALNYYFKARTGSSALETDDFDIKVTYQKPDNSYLRESEILGELTRPELKPYFEPLTKDYAGFVKGLVTARDTLAEMLAQALNGSKADIDEGLEGQATFLEAFTQDRANDPNRYVVQVRFKVLQENGEEFEGIIVDTGILTRNLSPFARALEETPTIESYREQAKEYVEGLTDEGVQTELESIGQDTSKRGARQRLEKELVKLVEVRWVRDTYGSTYMPMNPVPATNYRFPLIHEYPALQEIIPQGRVQGGTVYYPSLGFVIFDTVRMVEQNRVAVLLHGLGIATSYTDAKNYAQISAFKTTRYTQKYQEILNALDKLYDPSTGTEYLSCNAMSEYVNFCASK